MDNGETFRDIPSHLLKGNNIPLWDTFGALSRHVQPAFSAQRHLWFPYWIQLPVLSRWVFPRFRGADSKESGRYAMSIVVYVVFAGPRAEGHV